MIELHINESIIPIGFSWRAGIGKDTEKTSTPPKIHRGGYYPIYFSNEFYESLWYELSAEINDYMRTYVGYQMNTETYASIIHSINVAIIEFGGRYPAIYSEAFLAELDRLEDDIINKFYFEIDNELVANGLPHDLMNNLKYDAIWVCEAINTLHVSPIYVIGKIKEYSK